MKFPVPKTDDSGYKSAFDQGEILARIPGPSGMIQPYYHRYTVRANEFYRIQRIPMSFLNSVSG